MKTRMIFLCLLLLITRCGTKSEQIETADAFEEKFDPAVVKASSQNSPQQEIPKDLYSNGKTKLIKTLNYKF